MGGWLANNVISGVLNWFAEVLTSALNTLWGLLSATAFQSPNVTTLPQVTTFASTSLGIVNACYVLAFLAVAVMVMGRDTIQSRYGPSELIPRLVIGLIAANFALPICSTIIDLANAFTAALTSQSITSPGSMQLLRSTTTSTLSTQTGVSPSGFLLLLIALLIAVLVTLLMIQWIMRCALLIVLAGIAPIALALHGTPQTEGAAKLWWRAMLGTTGTVVIQAVALHTTLTIFLTPAANLTVLGLVTVPDDGATMNLLIVSCLLFAILKVPGLMRRYVTQTKPGLSGQIFRLVVIQQLTRGLSKTFRGRGTAAGRTANDASTTGGQGWPTTGRGAGRSLPPPGSAAAVGGRSVPPPTAGTAAASTGAARPSTGGRPPPPPRPSGAGPGRVGVAYPTRRAVRPYTQEELANGVDIYTRALKARRAGGGAQGGKTP